MLGYSEVFQEGPPLRLVEVGRLLRRDYIQVYRLAMSGVLEAYQPDGRHWVVERESVRRFLDRSK
jgi:hypothetical protein